MGGGLLNLVSYGNKNVIINGNPQTNFFTATYNKYTNFGMQKVRLDVNGPRSLKLTEKSIFKFKIEKYADLLMDTYFVINLPNIWSPIVEFVPNIPPWLYVPQKTEQTVQDNSNNNYIIGLNNVSKWPYEFKWIENLGSQLIKNVRYLAGEQIIQEFTGDYLYNVVQRDFPRDKRDLYDEMTGHTAELNDPANYAGRSNSYPNSIYIDSSDSNLIPEPSIRGRKIYVPLNAWNQLSSKLSIPLVSLYKNAITIEVTCRSIQELFVVKFIPTQSVAQDFNKLMLRINYDLFDVSSSSHSIDYNKNLWTEKERETVLTNTQFVDEYVRPNFVEEQYLLFRFVNPPVSANKDQDPSDKGNLRKLHGTVSGLKDIDELAYTSTQSIWYADAHLICNYAFLSEEERNVFKTRPQKYLIKSIYEKDFLGLQENNLLKIQNEGLVTSFMWFFRRSDYIYFNNFSNYTNWRNKTLPFKGVTNKLTNWNSTKFTPFLNNLFENEIDTSSFGYNYYTSVVNNLLYNNLSLDLSSIDYEASDKNLNSIENYYDLTSYDISWQKYYYTNSLVFKNINLNFYYLIDPYLMSGPFKKENEKLIMKNLSILLDGFDYDNSFPPGVFNYIEQYGANIGSGKEGLYTYNFNIKNDVFKYQPSGYINLSKYAKVTLNVDLLQPIKNENMKVIFYVDTSNEIIGINSPVVNIFKFDYEMHFIQERLQLITFKNGNIFIDNLIS